MKIQIEIDGILKVVDMMCFSFRICLMNVLNVTVTAIRNRTKLFYLLMGYRYTLVLPTYTEFFEQTTEWIFEARYLKLENSLGYTINWVSLGVP